MIRSVVVGRVRPGTDLALVQEALDAIVALPVEGLLEVRVGLDGQLRSPGKACRGVSPSATAHSADGAVRRG